MMIGTFLDFSKFYSPNARPLISPNENIMNTWKWLMSLFLICFHCVKSTTFKSATVEELRKHINEKKYLLLVFTKSKELCPLCSDAVEKLEAVETPELYDEEILKLTTESSDLASEYGITTWPTVIFIRNGVPALYEDDSGGMKAWALQAWLQEAQQPCVQTLTDSSFEHLTQASTGATTGDWLIIFYKRSCVRHLPAIEGAGIRVKHKMNVAKVDIDQNPEITKRLKVTGCPTTYFFRHGKMYQYVSEKNDMYRVSSLVSFVTSWYKNVKAEKVPTQPTAFDELTQAIADYIKVKLNRQDKGSFLLAGGIILGVAALIVSVIVALCGKKKEIKKD